MISLLKYLDGPWERVRGYLRDDLDHIESAINQRWNQTFGDKNLLKPGTIQGDSTPQSRSITNTGTGDNPLLWDQVDLETGVKGRLPFKNLVAATGSAKIVGRGSSGAGDFQELSIGSGLQVSGTTLSAINIYGMSQDGEPGEDAPIIPGPRGPMGLQGVMGFPGDPGEDGEDGIGIPGAAGTTGAAGVAGATGPQGLMGVPGQDGDDGEPGEMGPPGATGLTGATGLQGPMGLQGLMGPDGEDGEDSYIPGPIGPRGPTGATGGGSGSELDPVWIDGGTPTGFTFFGYNILDGGAP